MSREVSSGDWEIGRLRPHPENASIFGDPDDSEEFDEVLKSIRANGIWEPLIVKADGTVLSGHLRLACAERIGMKTVPVRVFGAFDSYLDEVKFLIRSNTDRRHLTPQQIAAAFKRLKAIPREEGGAKAKRGRPAKPDAASSERKGAESSTLIGKSRDEAARQLGVPRNIAEACEVVFETPGVPEPLKEAVNQKKVAPTTAAKAIRAEVKRQGGELKTTTALEAIADKAASLEPVNPMSEHERRVREQAKQYQQRYLDLFNAYKVVDRVLTSMPLKSLLGPTEHHEYRGIIRDIALRAWREIEDVDGVTNAGRQMALSVIKGGK